ncbi:MAG TPA: hypothetical protein VFG14_12225 [Chthoniobacteraceae bacterium]|nr:hypothetical protein [Chthoniobacteraceae bacterium]
MSGISGHGPDRCRSVVVPAVTTANPWPQTVPGRLKRNDARLLDNICPPLDKPRGVGMAIRRQSVLKQKHEIMELFIVIGAFFLAVTVAAVVFMHLDHA